MDSPKFAFRQLLKNLGFTIVALAILVGSPAGRLPAQTPASSPSSGDLVDMGGHKLYIDCVGPTNVALTVVFESGGGGSSKD